jgi:hypothetical protein
MTPAECARPIVTHLIAELIRAGFLPIAVDNGEEEVPVKSGAEAIDEIYSVDESTAVFRRADGLTGWVLLIPSNGEDVICDWPGAGEFDEIMDKICDGLEHFRCSRCGAVFPADDAGTLIEIDREPGKPAAEIRTTCCAGCESEDISSCVAAPLDE